jgi:hypothetical protein
MHPVFFIVIVTSDILFPVAMKLLQKCIFQTGYANIAAFQVTPNMRFSQSKKTAAWVEGTMASNERRASSIDMIRLGSDRRVCSDPNYKGPERRSGNERRTNKDRRKKT